MSIISDGFIYAVNGVTSKNIQIKGFTIDPINQNVTGFWSPESSVSIISFILPMQQLLYIHYNIFETQSDHFRAVLIFKIILIFYYFI